MPQFNVEEVSPIEKRIRVEVEPALVAAEIELAYKHLGRQVRLPGFRQGKVPRRILESRFKPQIESDVVQRLVEKSYQEALAAHPEVVPVAPPRVTNDELKTGEAFRYVAQVEVMPKVQPKDYDGLTLTKAATDIADVQIDEELEKLRQALSELVPVEGRNAAQEGDFAVVDFEGKIDGKPFPGSQSSDATMEVAAGEFTQGKAAALAGLELQGKREVEHAFPADYRVPALAGKTATFTVTLKSLKARKVPALDDELAKNVGGGQSLADLRERIRTELQTRAKDKAEREQREQLIAQLIERNPFEVPKAMVERIIDRMTESVVERLSQQGLDPRRLNFDVPRLRESMREAAVKEAKGTLLLEAIAEAEKIAATPEDMDAKIKELAEQMKAPEDRVRAYLSGETESRGMQYRIREEKTLAFLKSKAKIVEA